MAWGRYQYFPVEIEIEGKKEAVGTVMEWEDRKNAVWTDGRVGAACVWWQKGVAGTGHRRMAQAAQMKGRVDWERFHLEKNKEASGAELCALYRSTKNRVGGIPFSPTRQQPWLEQNLMEPARDRDSPLQSPRPALDCCSAVAASQSAGCPAT